MSKTKNELNQLKTEYLILADKLKELNSDELKLVTGGIDFENITEEEYKEMFNDTTHNLIEG